MRTLNVLIGVCLFCNDTSAKSLKGRNFDFVCTDTQFKDPFIDIDKTIKSPITCRYIHGGFSDGTRFSFYFPEKKDYTGRFFQYVTPFPDSETSAQSYPIEVSPICFSITHGAYFVETNEGGKLDFTDSNTKRDASIGAYRANAACAEFSRYVAKLIYNCDRPYGYCYGGSGDPYATLNVEQRQVLQECTRMGFPTVRVLSERNGDVNAIYTQIPNLGKVRVVVK